MKEKLYEAIEREAGVILPMADFIFDHPELAFEEWEAHRVLTAFLAGEGFAVERGLGALPTAFRAIFRQGSGGPVIGLLCEYDALEKLGHACGHHLQGPAVLAAVKAIKDLQLEESFTLVVYGTPGEEGGGGKIRMLDENYLTDIDLALMMHGGPATQTDVKSLAAATVDVTFHGKSAHAALKPESGRSALDALLLTFHAVEFLREHVPEDARMHYTVLDAGGPANVVPAKAVGTFSLRSYNSYHLDDIMRRFEKIVQGAALMTETVGTLEVKKRLEGKIPVAALNDLLMKNATDIGAPCIRPPRERTGSTDFGNVMRRIPGACIRVAFVDEGVAAHSEGYLMEGKTERGHAAIIYAAKILAGTVYDLITDPTLITGIQEEFAMRVREMSRLA